MICSMVNDALDILEPRVKSEGQYYFSIDVGGGKSLGSEEE